MFEKLEGWSFKVFGTKLLGRLIAPLSGFLVATFAKVAPESMSQSGQEAVQAAAGFLALVVVELVRNLLKFVLEKRKA